MIKTDMAYVFCFLDSRHLVKDILLEDTVTRVGINRKVTDTEAGEVLEEMRALS